MLIHERKPDSKVQLYLDLFKFFCDKVPARNWVKRYLKFRKHQTLGNENAYLDLIDFIGEHHKAELDFSTNNGILDAIDLLIDRAEENGNVKFKRDK